MSRQLRYVLKCTFCAGTQGELLLINCCETRTKLEVWKQKGKHDLKWQCSKEQTMDHCRTLLRGKSRRLWVSLNPDGNTKINEWMLSNYLSNRTIIPETQKICNITSTIKSVPAEFWNGAVKKFRLIKKQNAILCFDLFCS